MLNKVVLIGRLTKDPELRYTSGGTAVANFSLAVERSFLNQQGEKEVDFIPIVVWKGQAESCSKYLAKGRLVAVSGRIQVRNYDTPEGQRRYITEVIADDVRFLEWGDSTPNSGGSNNPDRNQPNDSNINRDFPTIDGDDDLPF